jgi:hypothetical protein
MAKLYQILRRPRPQKGEERAKWEFVAHGARYTKEEADEACQRTELNGWETKRLPL